MNSIAQVGREADARREVIEKKRASEKARLRDKKHEAMLLQCREDIHAFMEFCFKDSRTGKAWRQADVHREWHAFIDAHHRALVLTPREHGKTDQIAIARVLWELGKNPQLRIKIVSEDDVTAKKRLKAIKGHIERNKRLQEVFPGLRQHPELDDWTQHTITVERQGEDKAHAEKNPLQGDFKRHFPTPTEEASYPYCKQF